MRTQLWAELGTDPFAPLVETFHLLVQATGVVAIGLALGVACARTMRRLNVHWSWAALALAVAIAVEPSPAPAGGAAFVAAATAALCGRRWHREDLDTGLDLGEIATGRRTPVDALAAVWVRLFGPCPTCALTRRRTAPREGELEVGSDERGRPVRIPLGGSRGGSHALITGATGSGKTVTQATIAASAVSRGLGAVVVDPKGDEYMRSALAAAAAQSGRRFLEWTPAGPSVYNPYARGSDTEVADKVLASERFTEPHYQRQAQRYLGHVVRVLRESGVPTSLRSIVEHLDPPALESLVRELPDEEHSTHRYLDTLTPRQQSDLAGVRDRLAILAESDVGRWLDCEEDASEGLDLLDAVRARAVVYFSLEADSRPLLAQMLGGAIVQDLRTVVAALQGRPVPTVAVIDEFSALGAVHVVRLFGRARSAGINLLLGTQELADLRVPGHERLVDQVLGNLSVLIAHRQVVPDSAALVARLSGTRGGWRTSMQGNGRSTRTRIAEPVLGAECLLRLDRGCAALLDLERGADARVVHIRRVGGAR